MKRLDIKPLGRWGILADRKFERLMQCVTLPNEQPQKTHRWNNVRFNEKDIAHLCTEFMVSYPGDPKASRVPPIPIIREIMAHLLWRRYVVLTPLDVHVYYWFVGWRLLGGAGVSRILHKGPLRVLVGRGKGEWFGIGTDGTQIPIKKIGEGELGDDAFSHLPLF